jgi:ribosomal protein S17E
LELLDPAVVGKIFGDALSSDFAKTLAIFTAAAYVHGKQVRNEIKIQLTELASVLRADLSAQKSRIYRIEQHLDMAPVDTFTTID